MTGDCRSSTDDIFCSHLVHQLRLDSKSNFSDISPDGSHCIVLENIAETAHVCHMSLKLPRPIRTVVDLGLQVYAMLWAITLVDGGMDLLKYSIIPCFFLWPAARLFNTYNSMLYRLNYLLQAGTDWWLDYLNELPSTFLGHLSILHSSALFWLGIGKAASLWWTAQLDIIF